MKEFIHRKYTRSFLLYNLKGLDIHFLYTVKIIRNIHEISVTACYLTKIGNKNGMDVGLEATQRV